jgi:hypothetical protein
MAIQGQPMEVDGVMLYIYSQIGRSGFRYEFSACESGTCPAKSKLNPQIDMKNTDSQSRGSTIAVRSWPKDHCTQEKWG